MTESRNTGFTKKIFLKSSLCLAIVSSLNTSIAMAQSTEATAENTEVIEVRGFRNSLKESMLN